MKTATFTEFRKNAAKYFDAVENGERVRVLRHGRPVADLVRADDTRSTPSWKLPAPRMSIPGVSLSRAILDERNVSR